MTGLRSWIGLAALAALAALSIAIAAAGPEVVPASGRGGDPGWLLGLFGDGLGTDGEAVIWIERAALAAYAVVVLCAGAIPRRVLWAGIGGLVALFTLAPPLLSLDVFSYVSYARLETVHGLNPYELPPSAVPGDGAVPFVEDFRDQVSVYGPLFTLLTLPTGWLGVGGAVWTLKALAGASVLGTAAILARVAAARGVDPRAAAAFFALNPLVLVHVVGGAHNDALMALLMAAAVAAVLAGRRASGGAGLVASAAVKASALLVAPFALAGSDRRGRLAAGLAAGAAVVVAAGLAAFGGAVDEALRVVGQNQGTPSYASLPATISRESGIGIDTVRPVCIAVFAAAAAGLLAWTARGADWVRAAGWAMLGLLFASSYLTPWYVVWALPLIAVSRDRLLAAGGFAVSAFVLVHQVAGLGG